MTDESETTDISALQAVTMQIYYAKEEVQKILIRLEDRMDRFKYYDDKPEFRDFESLKTQLKDLEKYLA